MTGAGVAFDTKDYAHVDHGYAATFHKSQGVTVDRAHILATPGMDRHSAYVGMSRHRDDVRLHYGRDDFADQRQLVRVLSRDRGKDMAGDYAKPEQDQARAFADRREIRFPELARQVVEKVREKARGMFDGFRPKPAAEKATLPERVASDRPLAPSQARAIERYGRAAADIGRMRDKGLPVLAHQEQALAKRSTRCGRMARATLPVRSSATPGSRAMRPRGIRAARRRRWKRSARSASIREARGPVRGAVAGHEGGAGQHGACRRPRGRGEDRQAHGEHCGRITPRSAARIRSARPRARAGTENGAGPIDRKRAGAVGHDRPRPRLWHEPVG